MYVDNGGISKHGLPPHTTTSKLQLNYRTTIIQLFRTTRYGAEWKSYNYGIKEETTSRLVGGMETKNGLVPHSHVVGKNPEGYLGSKGTQSHTRLLPVQGSSARKISPHNFWL